MAIENNTDGGDESTLAELVGCSERAWDILTSESNPLESVLVDGAGELPDSYDDISASVTVLPGTVVRPPIPSKMPIRERSPSDPSSGTMWFNQSYDEGDTIRKQFDRQRRILGDGHK